MKHPTFLGLLAFTIFGVHASYADFIAPPPPSVVESGMAASRDGDESPGLFIPISAPIDDTFSESPFIAPPPPMDLTSAWESFFRAGYASKYDYKGMATGHFLNKNGAFRYEGGSNYTLPSGYILSGQAHYTDILDGRLKDHDQSGFQLNLIDEVFPNVYLNYGYSLVHGGVAGVYSKWDGAAHSVAQQFDFSARFDTGSTGYFFGFDVSYAFQGITGWWLGLTGGYRHEIEENFHLVFTVTASTSWSYWEADGFNQLSCKLEAPYVLDDDWIITPFIAVDWTGRSGLKMNSYTGERLFRPFTLMAGASVTFQF